MVTSELRRLRSVDTGHFWNHPCVLTGGLPHGLRVPFLRKINVSCQEKDTSKRLHHRPFIRLTRFRETRLEFSPSGLRGVF